MKFDKEKFDALTEKDQNLQLLKVQYEYVENKTIIITFFLTVLSECSDHHYPMGYILHSQFSSFHRKFIKISNFNPPWGLKL